MSPNVGRRVPVLGPIQAPESIGTGEAVPEAEDAKAKFDNVVDSQVPNQHIPANWRTAIRHVHHMFGHPSKK